MKVGLLYQDREWNGRDTYFDKKAIIEDLNLEVLFKTAARNQEEQDGTVQTLGEEDAYLEKVMSLVMMAPLKTKEEILYRQEVVKDVCRIEGLAERLYASVDGLMLQWDKLGKEDMKKRRQDSKGYLITQVKILYLFLEKLEELKEFLAERRGDFHSEGFRNLLYELEEVCTRERAAEVRRFLKSISFFCDGVQDYREQKLGSKTLRPVLELECTLSAGFKLENIWLDLVETTDRRYKKEKRPKTTEEKLLGVFAPERSTPLRDDVILKDIKDLEYTVVQYIMGYLEKFYNECQEFFEQLYIQSAFLYGAFRIYQRMEHAELPICFPNVCSNESISFADLKECNMALARRMMVIGNDADIRNKMLLVVTGANQGGKSTFLRSIGIAQILMQCGLFVSARRFESGIFPSLFTHFTRREDVQMNSGRLDEELGRMERMIRHLGPHSLMLLNESFATTTEREGSEIAYDIIRALVEAGVKVLAVTHLLSFAKRCYQQGMEEIEFLSAERLANGKRTFRMVQSEPELTSFGLDLYEKIIGGTLMPQSGI